MNRLTRFLCLPILLLCSCSGGTSSEISSFIASSSPDPASEAVLKANLANAYSAYAAEAADGVIEADGRTKIGFYSQGMVYLVPSGRASDKEGSKMPAYSYANSQWQTETIEILFGSGVGQVSLVSDTIAHSTFLSFTFYFPNL